MYTDVWAVLCVPRPRIRHCKYLNLEYIHFLPLIFLTSIFETFYIIVAPYIDKSRGFYLFQTSADAEELNIEALRKHYESFGFKNLKLDVEVNITTTCHAKAISKSKDPAVIGCDTLLCIFDFDI